MWLFLQKIRLARFERANLCLEEAENLIRKGFRVLLQFIRICFYWLRRKNLKPILFSQFIIIEICLSEFLQPICNFMKIELSNKDSSDSFWVKSFYNKSRIIKIYPIITMPKKIESWILSLVGYAESFKVDLIAIMQQNIETIGMIKAIFPPFSFLYYAVRFRKS